MSAKRIVYVVEGRYDDESPWQVGAIYNLKRQAIQALRNSRSINRDTQPKPKFKIVRYVPEAGA